jgi:hypothetical protein
MDKFSKHCCAGLGSLAICRSESLVQEQTPPPHVFISLHRLLMSSYMLTRCKHAL